MSLLRTQELTPSIYTEESRDFQLLSRLYDSVFNGLKFDTDSIVSLINTKESRTNILQLLQTKLGFFTEKKLDDEKLRNILECFPVLVKNKGSLKAVKETLYLFLRMYSVQSDIEIYYLKTPSSPPFSRENPCVLADGSYPENNSLVIRIHSFYTRPDITVLIELFKYILPAGVTYYIEFSSITKIPDLVLRSENAAELLFVSDNINSELRNSQQKFIGSGDSVTIIVSDEYSTDQHPFGIYYQDPETIVSENPNTTYTPEEIIIRSGIDTGINVYTSSDGQNLLTYGTNGINTSSFITTSSYVSNRFIGYYEDEESADNYLETVTDKLYSTAIINYEIDDEYEPRAMICVAYSNSTPTWYHINFLGNLTTEEVSTQGGIVSALAAKNITVNNGDLIKYNNLYLLRVNGDWQECNYARYILNTYKTGD